MPRSSPSLVRRSKARGRTRSGPRAAADGAAEARSTEKPRDRAASREYLDPILDAAEAVVLRDGIGRLTFDAVAKTMGRSKAGLLHHFPSKSEMIRAMVERHVAQWHDEYRATYDRLKDEGDPIPAVRAFMTNCLAGTHAWTEAERARNRVLVAALVHDESHVEPLLRVDHTVSDLLKKDALPPGVAEVIHLAVHGLWFQWIFGMGSVSERRLRLIRGVLEELIGRFGSSESSGDSGRKAVAPARERGVR